MSVAAIGRWAQSFANMFRNYTEGPDAPELEAMMGAINEKNHGQVAVNRINLNTNPTDNDTVTIGADVYEFLDNSAGSVAVTADANIGVERLGTAALTLGNLVAAINGNDLTADRVNTITLADLTTDAVAIGTESLRADIIGTNVLRVRSADGIGGTPIGASPSIATTDALTAAVAWDQANMNLGHGRVGGYGMAPFLVTVTAADVTAGECRISFPFRVEGFVMGNPYIAASGTPTINWHAAGADLWTIDENDLIITLGGGAAPDIQAGDTMSGMAFGVAQHT